MSLQDWCLVAVIGGVVAFLTAMIEWLERENARLRTKLAALDTEQTR